MKAGDMLGVYRILDKLGEGGMGEVYRARDTRLPREVAVKVSSDKFSERFTREAHIIAALNHPNISTLFDVGPDFLVMEMVEGPTLADHISQRPLSLEEAVPIARQIADALEYAHEHGVVHRDLKPGNVKLRPDGVVKVLDFGLAKASVGQLAQSAETMTATVPRTEVGVVMGTPAYMSPEQARGQEVDRRTDIWAFGCLFYEMLTGAPPHRHDTTQETMASILRDDPDLSKVPAQAHRLLKRCLEKDPQKRLRHIGDVMALLDEPPSGPYASTGPASTAVVETGTAGKWLWPLLAGVVLLAAAGAGLAYWMTSRGTEPAPAVRFEVGESEGMKFFFGGAMSVSPDGHWLVFPATSADGVNRYWLRSLDTVEARPLPGTEGAYVPAAWTADSRQVIFTVLGSSELRKLDIQGGPPQLLGQAANNLNGASSSASAIVFGVASTDQPLFRIPVTGGTPTPLTVVREGELGHKFPQFLPDGRRFLYFRASADPGKAGIYAGSLDVAPEAQSLERVLATDREAYYAPPAGRGSGHLIFMRGTTLLAQPFDPDTLALSGQAVPIAQNVDSFPGVFYGLFGVSDNGTLVYRGGAGSGFAVSLFDQGGRNQASFGEPDTYSFPAVSPDATRIAVSRGAIGGQDIWIVDPARNTTQRFTFDAADDVNPVWSPDGKDIAFGSNRGGTMHLYLKSADGLGDERQVSEQPGVPTSWSTDGRYLVFTSEAPKTGADIWILSDPRKPDARATPLVATEFQEQDARLSPDGRWLAYRSNESSPGDVIVRQFSADGHAGGKYLASRGIAGLPRWSADGRHLFYVTSALDLMVVDVGSGAAFQASTPRRLFSAPPPLLTIGWNVGPDGRFVFVSTPNGGKPASFTVVLNWAAQLEK